MKYETENPTKKAISIAREINEEAGYSKAVVELKEVEGGIRIYVKFRKYIPVEATQLIAREGFIISGVSNYRDEFTVFKTIWGRDEVGGVA